MKKEHVAIKDDLKQKLKNVKVELQEDMEVLVAKFDKINQRIVVME